MPSIYQRLILETTHCPQSDAPIIEEIMREDIFHSTLDWQTRSMLQKAAREAVKLRAAGYYTAK